MKTKKVLCLVLALVMVACCFTACGGKGGTEAKTTKAASGAKTFKIGGIGPTTGEQSTYGGAVEKGMKLAAKEINAAGGINGMQIDVNFQDDTNDAEKAVNAYNTLKDWGMQALIGTVTTNPCIAVQAKAAEDNMFLLTPSASAVEAIQSKTAFRVCFSDPNQGIASADYIAAKALSKKVAIIYNSSDTYSSGIEAKFAAEAKAKGLNIVATESFTSDNKTDFSAQLQKIKASGADLVFLPIYYAEAALILKQAKTAGLNVKYFGCDGLDGLLAIKNFDTSLAEGVMLLTPFSKDATDASTKKFVAAYDAAYNKDETLLNQFAADGYDAVYILKAAAEKAGITAGESSSDCCTALMAAMPKIKVDGVTGAGITWTADGEPSKAPKAIVINKGVYKAMD